MRYVLFLLISQACFASSVINFPQPTYYNFLLNAAFDYWQAGTSATNTDTGGATPNTVWLYQADQWHLKNAVGGGTVEGVITYDQVAGVNTGSLFGARVKITTAPTGTGIGNLWGLFQTLSNVSSQELVNAKTVTFQVLVKALGNVTSVNLRICSATSETKIGSTGSACVAAVSCTVNTSTWTTCRMSTDLSLLTVPTSAGVYGVGVENPGVSSGNGYDLNNGFIMEQAQFYVGSQTQPFRRQHSNPSDELAALQFFYRKSFNPTTAPATATAIGAVLGINVLGSASSVNLSVQFPPMRIAPSMTLYSPNSGVSAKCVDSTGADRAGSIGNTAGLSIAGISAFGVSCAAVAAGAGVSFHYVADARI